MKKSWLILTIFVPALAVILYLLSSVFTPSIVKCLSFSIIDIENRIHVFTETKEALFTGFFAFPYFYFCNIARVLHLKDGLMAVVFEAFLLAVDVILLIFAYYAG